MPVVESDGMTEAAHQMASNPLASELRKANSVGPAAGPEMAILNENCELCAAGQIGEVVIRGDNVTPGYAADSSTQIIELIDVRRIGLSYAMISGG